MGRQMINTSGVDSSEGCQRQADEYWKLGAAGGFHREDTISGGDGQPPSYR